MSEQTPVDGSLQRMVGLTESQFDLLAVGMVVPAAQEQLDASLSSKRRAMLLRVRDQLREGDIPADLADRRTAAWDILVEAERRNPEVVKSLLGDPDTGSWLAYTTRHYNSQKDKTPLWVHTAYLHTLAAAAGIHAGMDVDLPVPVNRGEVRLPRIGRALLPVEPDSPFDIARVQHSAAGTFIIGRRVVEVPPDGQESPDWQPCRWVEAKDGGLKFKAKLEVSTYGFHLPPRVPEPEEWPTLEQTRGWQQVVEEAWRVLVSSQPTAASQMRIDSIVPGPPSPPYQQVSASNVDRVRGPGIFFPPNARSLAAALVHESRHDQLYEVTGMHHLIDPAQADIFDRYSPLRNEPRSATGVYHAATALFGMTEFWRACSTLNNGPEGLWAAFEFAAGRLAFQNVVEGMNEYPRADFLTPLGWRFLDAMCGRAKAWNEQLVPNEIGRLVRTTSLGHYALWLAHHVRADDAAVAEIGVSFASKSQHRIPDNLRLSIKADPEVRNLDTWTRLARMMLCSPEQFQDLCSRPEDVDTIFSGATAADVRLIEGHSRILAGEHESGMNAFAVAEQLYGERLEEAPVTHNHVPLVGLGLARLAAFTVGRKQPIYGSLKLPHITRGLQRSFADQNRHVSAASILSWIG